MEWNTLIQKCYVSNLKLSRARRETNEWACGPKIKIESGNMTDVWTVGI